MKGRTWILKPSTLLNLFILQLGNSFFSDYLESTLPFFFGLPFFFRRIWSSRASILTRFGGGWTNPVQKHEPQKLAHLPQSSGWKSQTKLSCHHPVTSLKKPQHLLRGGLSMNWDVFSQHPRWPFMRFAIFLFLGGEKFGKGHLACFDDTKTRIAAVRGQVTVIQAICRRCIFLHTHVWVEVTTLVY